MRRALFISTMVSAWVPLCALMLTACMVAQAASSRLECGDGQVLAGAVQAATAKTTALIGLPVVAIERSEEIRRDQASGTVTCFSEAVLAGGLSVPFGYSVGWVDRRQGLFSVQSF